MSAPASFPQRDLSLSRGSISILPKDIPVAAKPTVGSLSVPSSISSAQVSGFLVNEAMPPLFRGPSLSGSASKPAAAVQKEDGKRSLEAEAADDESVKLAWPSLKRALIFSHLNNLPGLQALGARPEPAQIRTWVYLPKIRERLATEVLILRMDRRGGSSLRQLPELLEVFENLRALTLIHHKELKGNLPQIHRLKQLAVIDLNGADVRRAELPEHLQKVAHKDEADMQLMKVVDFVKIKRMELIRDGVMQYATQLMKQEIVQQIADDGTQSFKADGSAVPLLTDPKAYPSRADSDAVAAAGKRSRPAKRYEVKMLPESDKA